MALELVSPTRVSGERAQRTPFAESKEPNKYEVFIRQPDVVRFLRQLKIDNKDMKKEFVLMANKDDLSYTGTKMGGAGHGLNQVFTAGKMPFYARPTGIDKIRIGRISKEFNEKQYATKWSIEGKFSRSGTDYEEPKKGQRERMQDWIKSTGINFENAPTSLEVAEEEIKGIPEDVKLKDLKLHDDIKTRYTEELERLKTGELSISEDELDAEESPEQRLAELSA